MSDHPTSVLRCGRVVDWFRVTRLILNADDFGLTPGVNQSIVELHEAGALTSATLMATADGFSAAAAEANGHPAWEWDAMSSWWMASRY